MKNFWGAQTDPVSNAWHIAGALLFGALIITALIFVPRRGRKPLISAVTFIGGLYYSLEYLLPSKQMAAEMLASNDIMPRIGSVLFGWMLRPLASHPGLEPDQNWFSPYAAPMASWLLVIGGFTLAIGTWNLFVIHGKAIFRGQRNWPFSILFFVGVIFMTASGLLSVYRPNVINQAAFRVAFEGMMIALDSSMFSLIAFFIISASYRAFRIRGAESVVMMAAAFIVMLGQVPVGIWLTSFIPPDSAVSFLRLENLSYWVLTQPNAAAQRGIGFGIAVGALAMGLRIWLSLERGSYFEKEL